MDALVVFRLAYKEKKKLEFIILFNRLLFVGLINVLCYRYPTTMLRKSILLLFLAELETLLTLSAASSALLVPRLFRRCWSSRTYFLLMRKGLVTNLARQRLATPSEQWTGDPEGGGINTGQPNSRVEPNQPTAQCLKIKKSLIRNCERSELRLHF